MVFASASNELSMSSLTTEHESVNTCDELMVSTVLGGSRAIGILRVEIDEKQMECHSSLNNSCSVFCNYAQLK